MKLTQVVVDGLKFEGKERLVFCDGTPGFGVRVTPSGSKLFVAQGRLNKKPTRISIGKSTVMSVADAKRKARSILGDLAEGKDPRLQKKQTLETQVSFVNFSERWLTEKVDTKRKAQTAEDYRGVLKRHIYPEFGNVSLVEVEYVDVQKLHVKLKDKPRTANMAVGLVRSIINYAEKLRLRKQGTNPAFKFEMYDLVGRERFLSDEELERVEAALCALDGNGLTPWTVAAIRLLMLTGARSSEVRALRWEQIDRGRGLAFLPTSKNKKKRIIYLTPDCLSIIDKLPRRGEFVIAGNSIDVMCGPLTKQWVKVRNYADLQDVNLHDLRHTYASAALADGHHLPTVGKMLGHESTQATARYAHLASDPVAQAAQEVSSKIARTMKGESKATGKVHRFKRYGQ